MIFLLSLCAFFTSLLAAILGQGGGLILMPLLALFLPAAQLIPVHACIQLASNSSRVLFAWHDADKGILWAFIPGCLLGAIIMLPILQHINLHYLPLLIGLGILYLTWGKNLQLPAWLPAPFFLLGITQGSLGMLIGATGPLGSALLLKKGLNRDQLVASNALLMLISHLVKLPLFWHLNDAWLAAWPLILAAATAAIVGSWVGTHLRQRVPEKLFFTLFKTLITLLALGMITRSLLS